MDPNNVHSPKGRWRPVLVILRDHERGFSMTLGLWDNRPHLTCRWDGEDDDAKGMPVSSGYPVPFVLPDIAWEAMLGIEGVSDENQAFARRFLHLDEEPKGEAPLGALAPEAAD